MSASHLEGPRTNRDAGNVERKREGLGKPHMLPLVRFVERLREEHGVDRVPDFDPDEAGVEARILLLLEAPGPRATRERGGSGFVSSDNDDRTAENMWRLLREAGIDRRREVVTWNVVPWYLGDDRKIRSASSSDLDQAREASRRLIRLLDGLRVVVLIGRQAARGWEQLGLDVEAIEAPHPSPQNLNTRPDDRQRLLSALVQARCRAGSTPSGSDGRQTESSAGLRS